MSTIICTIRKARKPNTKQNTEITDAEEALKKQTIHPSINPCEFNL